MNNVTVDNDGYDEARTCRFQGPAERAFVSISNAACFLQIERVEYGMRTGSGNYLPEEYFLPGITQIDRGYGIGSIRFRRAVAATPNPQVTAR